MADITNPQIISFANDQIRPLADKVHKAYHVAKDVLTNYNTAGIGALVSAAGSSNLVGDGSAVDGRTRISGDDILNFITAMTALVAYVEGGAVGTLDRQSVITKPHVSSL